MANDTISIISINTRGTKKNYNKIIQEIKPFDISLLQEQHLGNDTSLIDKLQQDTNSLAYYTTDNKNKMSIVTLVKNNLDGNAIEGKEIIKGRVLSTKIKMGSKAIEIWNMYAPAKEGERLDFFKNVFRQTQDLGNLIIGGDFNTIINREDTNGPFTMKPYMSFLKQRMQRQNFRDIHSTLNTGKIKYTFSSNNSHTPMRGLKDKAVFHCHEKSTSINISATAWLGRLT